MRSYVLAFSLLLLTCAPPRKECNGRFNVDPGFSAGFYRSIYRSEIRWNEFSKKKVVFTDGTGDTCTIKPTTTDSQLHADLEEESGPWLGLQHAETGNIFLCTDVTAEALPFETMVLHELGHTVGMRHVPGHAIMSEDDPALNFTDEDHIECWRVRACD